MKQSWQLAQQHTQQADWALTEQLGNGPFVTRSSCTHLTSVGCACLGKGALVYGVRALAASPDCSRRGCCQAVHAKNSHRESVEHSQFESFV